MIDAPRLSAVICTYNRADRLADALHSLCAQTLDPALYEVIVIDNNSTDETPAIVRSFAAHGVRYVLETQQGLGYARNRGWQEARGKFVGYLDDDARAHPDLLGRALSLFSEDDPGLLCVGGVILPYYTSAKPEWFKDEYEIRTWGPEARYLRQGESFSGSNMIWRRDALAQHGGFQVDRGMRGDQLDLGEESGLFAHIWQTQRVPRFLYSPDLIVYHWVDPAKMTVGYHIKRGLTAGRHQARLYLRTEPRGRFLFGSLYRVVRGSLDALAAYRRGRNWRNWFYEQWGGVFVSAGALLEGLGISLRFKQR